MANYQAPPRDRRFVLYELLEVQNVLPGLPRHAEASPDLMNQVLEEAAKLAENVLLPLNSSGGEEGCHLENGVVRTPKGFKEAYAAGAAATDYLRLVGFLTYAIFLGAHGRDRVCQAGWGGGVL